MKKMRAYTNVLKLRVNMALKRRRVNNYPVQAYVEPTLFCNLRCPACPTGLQLGLRPSTTMKWELFKSAIDEIGDYVFELIMYNWGEPLLHKQTPEMIRYAKGKKLSVTLSSNLSLRLTDDYVERLVTSGLDRLEVSLDGTTEDAYSKYRRRGEFDLVRENMLRLQAAKKRLGLKTPVIEWKFLVFRHNEHQLPEVESDFRLWGADEIAVEGAIMPFEPYNDGLESSTIPKFNMYHPDHHFQSDAAEHDRSGRPCTWVYGILVLNPNGKVSPCCASASEATDFADYSASGGFFDAWNNATFQRARALFGTSPETGGAAADAPASGQESGGAGGGLVQIEARPSKARAGEAEADRIAGMAANLSQSLTADELICHKCPIPWRQDDVVDIIEREVVHLSRSFWEGRSVKTRAAALSSYLLMGAPGFREQLRLVFVRARNSLGYRFGRLVTKAGD